MCRSRLWGLKQPRDKTAALHTGYIQPNQATILSAPPALLSSFLPPHTQAPPLPFLQAWSLARENKPFSSQQIAPPLVALLVPLTSPLKLPEVPSPFPLFLSEQLLQFPGALAFAWLLNLSQAHLREVPVLAQVISQKFNCLPSRRPFRSLTSAVISLMLPFPQTHAQRPLWGLFS